MLRSVASKVAWVGRTASMVFGLALVLALIIGVASMALAANGDPLRLGQNNVATLLTKLTANVNGSAMQITNTNAGNNATALNLQVANNKPPMKVNSDRLVTNLNADSLDGADATQIGRQSWAVINADGTVNRGRRVDEFFTKRLSTGEYQVAFNHVVDTCAYTATTTNGFAGQTGVRLGGDGLTELIVYTTSSDGTQANLPFNLIVAC